MISFRQVAFSYRPREAVVAAVDLDLQPGLTLLVGRNGCGKSTLLKLAAGIERPDAGRIEVDGHDLWKAEVAARRQLAYVPEQPDLTPYATVAEILRLVCDLRGEAARSAAQALAFVGLQGQAQRSVRELSMGQRRKAVLAAALIGTPRHLLLDEPLEALDLGSRADLLAWLAERLAAGAVALIASHDLEPFAASAARVLTVAGGRCQLIEPLPANAGERLAAIENLAKK
jgi:ABC-type multidrug transport system ATPase subunit